jgi:hypothetical protein
MPPSPRPANYPLDVTPRFTTLQQKNIGQRIGPMGNAANGLLHDSDGDLRVHIAVNQVVNARRELYLALGYLDLIDLNVVTLDDRFNQFVQQNNDKLASLKTSTDSLVTSLEKVIGFLGSVIPQWLTQEEVENGDDMGVTRLSAADLGLTVVFETVQNASGFGHQDVVEIRPPAGSLVARGSTVTIVINLEG